MGGSLTRGRWIFYGWGTVLAQACCWLLSQEPPGDFGLIQRAAQASRESLAAPAQTGPTNASQIRIQGVITLVWGRETLFLLDANGMPFRVQVPDNSGLSRGDWVEATGLLKADETPRFLEAATVRKTGSKDLPPALRLELKPMLEHAKEGMWIQIQGRLMDFRRSSNNWIYVLERGSWTYYARLETNRLSSPPPTPPSGSMVSVRGIYTVKTGVGGDRLECQILMSSPLDIQFSGSWWAF
ncbi:MAG TPA: hypothetical protein P5055_16570, partial [Candidatus Paceibacterota bacterium]|nr:hypothetical protein [Candidatus Paceibacterota bacterium]